MKESMSVTYIFQIVILFILLFTAIMALTINNSNAFGIKDQIVNIIEANGGNYLDDDNYGLSDEITDLIKSTSYRGTGTCEYEDGYRGYTRAGDSTSGSDASICIKEVNATAGVDKYLTNIFGEGKVATGDFMPGKYYQIVVFFQLDIPVVKKVYNFPSKAETKVIYEK